MSNQPPPQKDASQQPFTFGQFALFFPAFLIFDIAFLKGGGLPRLFHNFFEAKSSDELAANREAFLSCFRSQQGAAYCIATILLLVGVVYLGSVLFKWLGKGSVAANWVNTCLAGALLALTIGLYRTSTVYEWIIAGGWATLAAIGLFERLSEQSTDVG
jgi:hypothetical protein